MTKNLWISWNYSFTRTKTHYHCACHSAIWAFLRERMKEWKCPINTLTIALAHLITRMTQTQYIVANSILPAHEQSQYTYSIISTNACWKSTKKLTCPVLCRPGHNWLWMGQILSSSGFLSTFRFCSSSLILALTSRVNWSNLLPAK